MSSRLYEISQQLKLLVDKLGGRELARLSYASLPTVTVALVLAQTTGGVVTYIAWIVFIIVMVFLLLALIYA